MGKVYITDKSHAEPLRRTLSIDGDYSLLIITEEIREKKSTVSVTPEEMAEILLSAPGSYIERFNEAIEKLEKQQENP